MVKKYRILWFVRTTWDIRDLSSSGVGLNSSFAIPLKSNTPFLSSIKNIRVGTLLSSLISEKWSLSKSLKGHKVSPRLLCLVGLPPLVESSRASSPSQNVSECLISIALERSFEATFRCLSLGEEPTKYRLFVRSWRTLNAVGLMHGNLFIGMTTTTVSRFEALKEGYTSPIIIWCTDATICVSHFVRNEFYRWFRSSRMDAT